MRAVFDVENSNNIQTRMYNYGELYNVTNRIMLVSHQGGKDHVV